MRKHYVASDFINPKEERPEGSCEKTITTLYELCILHTHFNKCGQKTSKDIREAPLREILLQYDSELQIKNAVHDIVVGNKTLNQFLSQHGYDAAAGWSSGKTPAAAEWS